MAIFLSLFSVSKPGGDEGLRIGMKRRVEDLLGRGKFHDFSRIHHRYVVADMFHDAEVVGNEKIGQPELILEFTEEIENLSLDRYVQG